MGEWLAPTEEQVAVITHRVEQHYDALIQGASSWWEETEWVLSFHNPFPLQPLHAEEDLAEVRSYWATFSWESNPWVRDPTGSMLNGNKYNRIRKCTIAELGIQRTGPREFTFNFPEEHPVTNRHSNLKLQRWATTLLLPSPEIKIGHTFDLNIPFVLRQAPSFVRIYEWVLLAPGHMEGRSRQEPVTSASKVTVRQADDGFTWKFQGQLPELTSNDQQDLTTWAEQLRTDGIVFTSHPLLHNFPWRVPDITANNQIGRDLDRQTFRRSKKVLAGPLQQVMDRLETKAKNEFWQHAALDQSPKQAWEHAHKV